VEIKTTLVFIMVVLNWSLTKNIGFEPDGASVEAQKVTAIRSVVEQKAGTC
jgi:hypothetical protein